MNEEECIIVEVNDTPRLGMSSMGIRIAELIYKQILEEKQDEF